MQTLRRQARSFALQLLYQAEVHPGADASARERFWEGGHASRKARAFASELVEATLAHRDQLDAALGEALEEWKLSRLPVLVRNVLRMAACELLVVSTEPPAAIINEAVELTRSYIDEESARFVNSVLDALKQRTEGTSTPPQAIGSP